MEEDDGFLLMLQEPSFVDLRHEDVLLADVLRHRSTVYEGAPHGYYVVCDEKDAHILLLFKFFHGNDIFRALKEARLSFMNSPAESELSDESDELMESGGAHSSWIDPGTHRQESSCAIEATPEILTSGPHVPVIITSSPDNPSFKILRGEMRKHESNSLVPIDPDIFRTNRVNLYCASIEIDGRNFPEFMGQIDLQYHLPVDIGDTTTWLYANAFQQLQHDLIDETMKPWPSEDHPAFLRKVVPEPDCSEVLDTTLHSYADGTRVLLRRWGPNRFIPVHFPSWDWTKNKKAPRLLKLPYVLAIGATDMTATRPWDGNLGLGIPRANTHFFNPKDADFTTTYDALFEDGSALQTPAVFTVRFRYPINCSGNNRARSFVYFGNYWPCALETRNGGPFVPTFGDKIHALPTTKISLGTKGDDKPSHVDGSDKSGTEDDNIEYEYSKWCVQLLSMTLLVPKKDNPNHTSTSEDDWEQIAITFPEDRMHPETANSGLPTLLDTRSTFSHFPQEVYDQIKTLWLRNEVIPQSDRVNQLYCKPGHNLDACDIIFLFTSKGSPVKFRCTASRFLKSPWKCRNGTVSPIQSTKSADRGYRAVLGMNFFWTAFVRHDGRGGDSADPECGPYIQLAPQRYIDAEGNKFEDEFVLRDGLLGRAKAISHNKSLKMCE